jgi:hypothetical protein
MGVCGPLAQASQARDKQVMSLTNDERRATSDERRAFERSWGCVRIDPCQDQCNSLQDGCVWLCVVVCGCVWLCGRLSLQPNSLSL